MLNRLRWFRLLFLFLLGKKESDPLLPVESTFWVSPFDVELVSASSNTYGAFTALSRWDFTFQKCSMIEFVSEGKTPFTYSEIIRFRRAMKLLDKVRVVTRLFYWDNKMIYLEHRFYVKDKLVAIGIARGAYWGKDGRISPQEIFSGLGKYTGDIPDVVANMCKTDDSINQL